ncbi:MMS19 nucleotide excision repair protein homolog isoform X2 [Acropora muricata]|uniref:MMS19 nucleotide excision repair protein homolog isoform X2 n=1 Tax=Acropora muricata TaxID=159855 RepID=UPI0034E5A951
MASTEGNGILTEENFEERLSLLIQDICSKRLELVTIVEDLGPQLTSTDLTERCLGVRFLANVLHRLVGFPFQEKEVALFSEFLCDRLKDNYTIIPHALFGLLSLATNQNLADEDCLKITQTIFKEVHVQSLLKDGRLTIFNLFAVLLNKHLKVLTTVGNDFVFGFIQAMDGEKDPRNLMLVFDLVRVIVRNFSIDLFVEDLFEVTSCYFPVDFTPPSDDPYGITKEDLVARLRNCLAATNQFAPFCLPLLMEKLSSDIIDAKIDSLLTLSTCLDVYHSTYVLEHVMPLWRDIKRVVFYSSSTELEEASLLALTSIVRNLSDSIEENVQEKYEELLETVLKDCNHLTGSNDVKLIKSCGRILHAVALSTESSCQKIIDSIFPLLFEQFKEMDVLEVAHRKFFIFIITGLLKAAKTFYADPSGNPVVKYKDRLSVTLFSTLSGDHFSLCCAVVDCLMALLDLTGVLTEKEVGVVSQHLTSLVLANKENSLSQISRSALSQLSKMYPDIIQTTLLPTLLMHLKTEDGSAMDTDGSEPHTSPVSHQCVLDTLAAVCTQDSVVHDVIPRLIEHVQHMCEDNLDEMQCNRVLDCVHNIIEDSIQRDKSSAVYFKRSVVPTLLRVALQSALKESSECFISKESLQKLAGILRTVTYSLDIEEARDLLNDFVTLYVDGNSSFLDKTFLGTFFPLELTAPWRQTQLVSLLTATLCSARREVTIPRQTELVPRLQYLACHCDHERSAESGAQCLAGIINKAPEGDELTSTLNELSSRIWQNSDKEGSRKRATKTWLWLTKAVVIRSHALAPKFIEMVLSLMKDREVGRLAADGFYIIVADFDEVMNVKMHANCRMMYRQRLFMEVSQKLIEGFNSAQPEFKHHHLCALSHLLSWIPKQVLLSEVPRLMPLLVQSLSCDEQSLKLSTLHTMYSLMFDAPEIIARQVTSLVPILLRLSQFQISMKIRMESLKCLGAMTTLPHHVVYPYKTKVCKTLADSVDDKKRLVRKEAVKCRNKWYLLGSSTR